MYPTVPSTTPASVPAETVGDCVSSPLSPAGAVSFARPKSRILAVPSLVTITFSGLRSRCTIPVSWALARPSAIWVATASSFFRGIGPAARSLRSVSPSTRSMAIHDVPLGRADVVDRDDVGMVERGGRARLLFESLQALRVVREVGGKDLDRHVAPEARVIGPVDLSHPARAERREDLVGAEARSGRKCHPITAVRIFLRRGVAVSFWMRTLRPFSLRPLLLRGPAHQTGDAEIIGE